MELQPSVPPSNLFLNPTFLHSLKVFSKCLIWISYIATEATSIPAYNGPGHQVNSGFLLGLSCTSSPFLFCLPAILSFSLNKPNSFKLPTSCFPNIWSTWLFSSQLSALFLKYCASDWTLHSSTGHLLHHARKTHVAISQCSICCLATTKQQKLCSRWWLALGLWPSTVQSFSDGLICSFPCCVYEVGSFCWDALSLLNSFLFSQTISTDSQDHSKFSWCSL